VTTDNDIVFRKWKEFETVIHTPFFFTEPYHSWEKGLVENTNRWIRCFVSKRRDISTVSDDELRSIEVFLNETPRQCLEYRTAMEVLLESTKCPS
jgi:IS30 family transposase